MDGSNANISINILIGSQQIMNSTNTATNKRNIWIENEIIKLN